MTSSHNRTLAVAGMALTLTACGKVGTLEQPAPLYGAKAKANYEAAKQAAAQAKTQQAETGKPEPLPADRPPAPDTPK